MWRTGIEKVAVIKMEATVTGKESEQEKDRDD